MGLNEMLDTRKKSNLANARAREDLELIARFRSGKIDKDNYDMFRAELTANRTLEDNPEKSLGDLALRVAGKGTAKAVGAVLSLGGSGAKSVGKGIVSGVDNLLFRGRKKK